MEEYLDGAEFSTLAVRAGQRRSAEGEHSEALYMTSSFVFDSCHDASQRFSGQKSDNVYSRYTNPTVRNFEERLAALERAEACAATSSGMAAILSVCMAFLRAGEHVVCSKSVFGTTTGLFKNYMAKFDVRTTFVDLSDMAQWESAIADGARLVFVESPSNPTNDIVDLRELSALTKANGALLVVDNCFSTPVLSQPLSLGADLVVHSATKFLDGQGRVLGGAVCGAKELVDEVVVFLRTCGPTMSAFNAWVFLKGLETLEIRMKAHSENALAVAKWLVQQPSVTKVNYCGLEEHPSHAIARQQMSGFGAVLSFEVDGGQEAGWRFIDATQLCSLTANLGDVKTTIVHPATTTHGRISDEERAAAGITPGLIRLCVGLESSADIILDLQRGLAAI